MRNRKKIQKPSTIKPTGSKSVFSQHQENLICNKMGSFCYLKTDGTSIELKVWLPQKALCKCFVVFQHTLPSPVNVVIPVKRGIQIPSRLCHQQTIISELIQTGRFNPNHMMKSDSLSEAGHFPLLTTEIQNHTI